MISSPPLSQEEGVTPPIEEHKKNLPARYKQELKEWIKP